MNYNYPIYPQVQPNMPTVVYVPQIGSRKINKSVSVIAIILLIALLFVGMKLISEDGFYKNQKLDWNRGYINTETGKANDTWNKWNSYGMYTVDPIEIGKGVKIELKFDSKMTYQVLVYDANDEFLGTLGDPTSSGQKLDNDDFTGEFSAAKYIRLYAYEKSEEVNGINPTDAKFTFFDMLTRASDFKVSTLEESNIKDNLEDLS